MPPVKMLKGKPLRDKIQKDPAWAMRKILGIKPWSKQVELAEAVFHNLRTECSGCVASGKTFDAAAIVPLWLMRWAPRARVFSIAPSFRQVDTNLWGYIPRMVRSAELNGTPLGCKVFTVPRIEFSDELYYEGFSTDHPENVHGIHGPHDLLIIDDAQGVPLALTEELENIMAGGTAHILMLHNRVVSSGPSYDVAHKDAALWAHVSISFYDMPNSDPKREKEWIPGALTIQAAESWKKKYGEKSNFYRSKVLNEYPTAAPDTLIALDWVEMAFNRKVANIGVLVIGGDIAAQGDDASAMALMRGREVFKIESWNNDDLMYTTGKFAKELKDESILRPDGSHHSAFAFLDLIGMGGGPVWRLIEQGLNCTGVDWGESAEGMVQHGDKYRPAKEVFVNKRSQMWWNLRECLDPSNKNPERLISLPPDLEVQAMLTSIKYRFASDGRIEVEPKHVGKSAAGKKSNWGLKNRLGHTLDKGDSVVYAVWGADRCGTNSFDIAGVINQEGKQDTSRFGIVNVLDNKAPEVPQQNDGGLEGVW